MAELQGRTAFITGGANGIGLGIARACARAGARLVLADLDGTALAAARDEFEGATEVATFELDVRDRDAYAKAADEAERIMGPVFLLVNNAGVAGRASAADLTYELWDWVMGVNLNGVINGVQTFLPRMIERGRGGHIVNTASGAGLAATRAGVLYTASKYGVVGLSEALSLELAPHIGVSVLCPGPVATDIVNRSANASPAMASPLSKEQSEKIAEERAMATAMLQRGATIDAVGEMVVKAVRDNRLYIHTDRIMEDLIKNRTKALLDAMPSGEPPTAITTPPSHQGSL